LESISLTIVKGEALGDPIYFCVQTFWRDAGRIQPRDLKHYPTAAKACRAAEAVGHGIAGAVAYEVSARPEYGIWGDPRLLAVCGEVPNKLTLA